MPTSTQFDLLSLAEVALSAPAELAERAPHMGAEQWLQFVLDRVDSTENDIGLKAKVSNAVARVIMGWSLYPDDPRRIWREPDGSPVVWNGHDSKQYVICAQPWIDGVNQIDEHAFAPGTNYHANLIADWRDIAYQQARLLDGHT